MTSLLVCSTAATTTTRKNGTRHKPGNTCVSKDKSLGDLDVVEIFAGIGATRRMNNPVLPAVLD